MKILVIGELCKDKFVYGKISRLCPEAPVPIFNPIETVENPGMAGNVVENLVAMSKNAQLTFWHQPEKITKKRLVDEKSNQMIVRIDEGELNSVTEIYRLGYLSGDSLKSVREFDLVIVSDYNKGFLSDAALIEIAAYAKFSILDSKRSLTKTIIDLYTFVKLNEDESLRNAEFSALSNVIVTLGKKGARVGEKFFPQLSPKETIDVSGAGDTFVSAFGLKYFESQDLEHSINFANSMAASVVNKRGVATP